MRRLIKGCFVPKKILLGPLFSRHTVYKNKKLPAENGEEYFVVAGTCPDSYRDEHASASGGYEP